MMGSERYFSHPSEFEPLLPERRRAELTLAGGDVVQRSIALTSAAHPSTIETLRDLLREMNSYYSNRIEGQGTHPLDIARALRSDYSNVESVAQLQRLALAHIHAEQSLEGTSTSESLQFAFLQRAHALIYADLPVGDRLTSRDTPLLPGEFRDGRVVVGRHIPPEANSLPAFARRFDHVYGQPCSLNETLMTVAAAHQRASWIHPFEDGNGRAIRLQTHCALFPLTRGMWSVSRGLARNRDGYYAHLARADAPRSGDLDGRGRLSDAALASWCAWFIEICADQIDFMTRLLDVDGVKRRVRTLITARLAEDNKYRIETVPALVHLFATGPSPRAEFFQLTGLGERTARSALAHLLKVGLVTSPDHRSPVRIAFPLDALQLLFPDLYPEAGTTYPT
jgi:Fic family protein